MKNCFKITIVVVLISFIVLAVSSAVLVKASKHTNNFTVVIDAGHGGIDGGASGINTGARESDINLLISKELKKLFEKANVKVIMTRNSDEGLYGTTDKGFKLRDLQERVKIVNNSRANLLISIHLNVYSSPRRRGAQVFYKKGEEKSKIFAKKVQSRINGMRLSPRIYDALSGDYYILNQVKIPAIIVECGFLSSPEDEKLLLTSEYRESIANAIFNGTIDKLVL